MTLTPAQKRYLKDIREAGPAGKTYNGRGTRVLEALEAAGLIEVEWWIGGYTPRELHTARANTDICPGSGRKWGSGTGNPICPVCHRGPGSFKVKKPIRRKGRWTGTVPEHPDRRRESTR